MTLLSARSLQWFHQLAVELQDSIPRRNHHHFQAERVQPIWRALLLALGCGSVQSQTCILIAAGFTGPCN